ncbi:MAG: hypothetical protein H7844_16110 [Nitrospirae bacterium YQR-1]
MSALSNRVSRLEAKSGVNRKGIFFNIHKGITEAQQAACKKYVAAKHSLEISGFGNFICLEDMACEQCPQKITNPKDYVKVGDFQRQRKEWNITHTRERRADD